MSEGMKWADLDSDDSDDESVIIYDTQPAGLNDGTVQAPDQPGWGDSDESDEEQVDEEDDTAGGHESEEDVNDYEETEEAKEALRRAREEKKLKEEEQQKEAAKPLTKKEKQALKSKEMDDLESLLNEFGVAPDEEVVAGADDAKPDAEGDAAADDKSSKKKKKRKKKKTATSSSAAAAAETTEEAAKEDTGKTVDIASVLKKKGKTFKEIKYSSSFCSERSKSEGNFKKRQEEEERQVCTWSSIKMRRTGMDSFIHSFLRQDLVYFILYRIFFKTSRFQRELSRHF